MSLIVVKPVQVTPDSLIATDVPENDYPVWVELDPYDLDDRVIYNHKIYESLQDGNVARNPATSPTYWIEVSPTNRWKAFDLSNSTKTAQADEMYFEIEPGRAVNCASVLNCEGVREVRYRVTDPSFGLVYDKTHTLTTIPLVSNWYDWFFSERVEQSQNIDLDLPSYPNATVRIDFVGASSMAVGVILLGQQKSIGMDVLQGASIGIQDFSRKEKNDYGDTLLVERAFAKRASYSVFLDNKELDNVHSLLSSIRATPCLWIGSSRHVATTIFGFFKEFDITINYADFSDCSIDLEGLT